MYELEDEKEKQKDGSVIVRVLATVGAFIFSSIEIIVTCLAMLVVLYLFILTPHEVLGNSMHPTYKNGEYLLANKVIYKIKEPKRGDVIIFKHSPTQDYIKRIIGLPGDTVSLRDGSLYLNGARLKESEYLDQSIYTNKGSFLDEGETITVPENTLFVCGDNRQHSSDSREFGPIEQKDVKGKVWLVYFPFSDFRMINGVDYNL